MVKNEILSDLDKFSLVWKIRLSRIYFFSFKFKLLIVFEKITWYYDVIIPQICIILNIKALICTNNSSFERYDWEQFNFLRFKSSWHTHDLSCDYDVIILKNFYIFNSWALILSNESSFERYEWERFNFLVSNPHTIHMTYDVTMTS